MGGGTAVLGTERSTLQDIYHVSVLTSAFDAKHGGDQTEVANSPRPLRPPECLESSAAVSRQYAQYQTPGNLL